MNFIKRYYLQIDEPKTPYSGYSDHEEEVPSSSQTPGRRRVSLVGIEKTLENGAQRETRSPNIGESSDDEELDEEEKSTLICNKIPHMYIKDF